LSLADFLGALTFGKNLAEKPAWRGQKKIPGANILRESFGKYTYWRAWLGKKFTGGKALQKRFSSYAKAARWAEEMRQGEEQYGKAIFSLSFEQLAPDSRRRVPYG
jgi:hypothetical protein